MTLRSRVIPWMVALATIVAAMHLAAPVCAQDYTEETIAEVNAHFQNGAKLYYDGDYDAAIVEFEAAHAKIPNAIFLYNISLSQAKKGDNEKALATAEAAQQFGGLGADEQVQNEARIAALHRLAASERTALEIRTAHPPPEPLLDFRPLDWVGAGLVVGGIVGFGVVLGIDRSMSADVAAYKAAAERGDTVRYEVLRDELRPRQTTARVLFVLSSVAVVSGAAILVYDLVLRKDRSRLTVAPIRGGLGVSFTQQF